VEAALPGSDIIAFTRELQGVRPLLYVLWVGADTVSTIMPFLRVSST
jgi:hypothetical protein